MSTFRCQNCGKGVCSRAVDSDSWMVYVIRTAIQQSKNRPSFVLQNQQHLADQQIWSAVCQSTPMSSSWVQLYVTSASSFTVSWVTKNTSMLLPHHASNICDICIQYITLSDTNWLNAYVTPRLDYCNAILSGLSKSTTAPLQHVHYTAARLILHLRGCEHVTPVL